MNIRRKLSCLLRHAGLLRAARAGKIALTGYAKDMMWKGRNNLTHCYNSECPIPPPSLCFTVIANYDIESFLRTGKQGADSIRDILERNNHPIERFVSILDFGCGCGRITRQWISLGDTVKIAGTDINPKSISWTRSNYKFGNFSVNGISSPLAFGNDEFDFVYALSVFTHLDGTLQKHWMAELRRVLKPGGLLLVTTKGSNWMVQLNSSQQKQFSEGCMVVLEPEASGSNYCAAFHPPEYVRNTLASNFMLLEHEPCGSVDISQDFYLLMKPHKPF